MTLKGQIPAKTCQRPPAGGLSAFQHLRSAAAGAGRLTVSPFIKVKPFW